MINILFLGGSKRISVAKEFIERSAQLGRQITIYAYELNPHEPISEFGIILKGLKWNDPNLINDLSDKINEYKIDIVIPFVDIATIVCSRLKEKNNRLFFPGSSLSLNLQLMDKCSSESLFVKHSILIPESTKTFPLIAKIKTGSGGKGIFIAQTHAQEQFFFNSFNEEDYHIQRFLDGTEYSVDSYITQVGDIISVVPRERVEAVNGEATRSKTCNDLNLIELTRVIIGKLSLKGVVTLQFIKEHTTGAVYLIEINPRFGSGVVTSIAAGASIPGFILNEFLGLELNECVNWRPNLEMVRYFSESFFYADNN